MWAFQFPGSLGSVRSLQGLMCNFILTRHLTHLDPSLAIQLHIQYMGPIRAGFDKGCSVFAVSSGALQNLAGCPTGQSLPYMSGRCFYLSLKTCLGWLESRRAGRVNLAAGVERGFTRQVENCTSQRCVLLSPAPDCQTQTHTHSL